jgi:CHASE3 domain sensor protein
MAQETLRIRKETEHDEMLRDHLHDEHCNHKHEEVEEVLRGERLALLEIDLKKYKHAQADVIDKINEQLEEIRYTMEDLRELYQEQKEQEKHQIPQPTQKEEPIEQGLYL